MITTETQTQIESSGILKELQMGIRPENMGVIFSILRSQIYTDKPLAIIREIASNAKDAHVESNQSSRPIKVVLPSQFEPMLKIRDFGFGLSEKEVEDIFVNYGSSTKRNSNLLIGSYGIGSKSPFSYTNSFTVNSYQQGVCYSYCLFIDESERGKMSLMSKTETTEPAGLEVCVPINYCDINTFKEKAVNFFKFWDVLPEFENPSVAHVKTIEDFRKETPLFCGDNWKIFNDDRAAYAIMGNVPYKIDRYALDDKTDDSLKALLGYGCYLYFDIGELNIVASREGIEMTNKSKNAITAVLQKAFDSIKQDVQDKFTSCKTLWECKSLYREIFDGTGKYYRFRNIVSSVLKFNGVAINNDVFYTNNVQPSLCYYAKIRGKRYGATEKIKRISDSEVKASKDNILVINDLKLDKGIMNRVVPLIEDKVYKTVYLIEDGANKDLWIQETGYDGPTLLLSSLPKVNLQKYYPKTSNGSSYVPVSRAKVMILGDVNLHRNRASAYWEDCNVTKDLAKDSGVYLPMLNYKYQTGDWYSSPDKLSSLSQLLTKAGIQIPTIYGIKMSAVAKVKNNPNMVNFWDWVKKEAGDLIAQNAQNLIDYKQFYQAFESEGVSFDRLKPVVAKLDASNPIAVFGEKLDALDKGEKWDAMSALAQKFAIDIPTKLSYSNWKKDWTELKKKYPLFFRLLSLTSSYNYDKEMQKELVEYVSIVDDCV